MTVETPSSTPPVKRLITSHHFKRVFISIIAIIALIGAGSLSYVVINDYLDSKREDYCLVFSEQDFGPILNGITNSTEDEDDGVDFSTSDHWICRIDGENGQRLLIESTSRVNFYFSAQPGLTVKEDRSKIPGAVITDVPGSDATVVSWTGDRGAAAGWFEGEDSAVVVYTDMAVEQSQREPTAKILADAVVRRAPTLLRKTGFTPTHTPTTTPDPAFSPT